MTEKTETSKEKETVFVSIDLPEGTFKKLNLLKDKVDMIHNYKAFDTLKNEIETDITKFIDQVEKDYRNIVKEEG